MQIGIEGHVLLSNYIREGTWLDIPSTHRWEVLKSIRFPEDWNFLATEMELECSIVLGGEAVVLTGILDAVYTDSNGDLWVLDHKFSNSNNAFYEYLMSPQGWVYAYLYSENFEQDVAGFVVNYINIDFKKSMLKYMFYRNVFESGWKKGLLKELDLLIPEMLYWDEQMQRGILPYRSVQRDCIYCEYLRQCINSYHYK
jgi:hypothetical protein